MAIAKTHNSLFAELQEEYLRTRGHKCLDRMYRLCVDMATNYIRKYARDKGLPLDIPELAHDSAVYVIEQYLKKPGFRIDRISAYMHFGCVKSLFRNKEREQREISYEEFILDGGLGQTSGAGSGRDSPPPSGGLSIRVAGRFAPEAGTALRGEPAMIRQGLLFEDAATGKDYEEIFV